MASATSQSISHLSPRHSATDSFISEATFDSYCYITDTFTLANQRKTGVHPGVGPEIFSLLKYFLSPEIFSLLQVGPGHHREPETIFHSYYQWVPFLLLIQAEWALSLVRSIQILCSDWLGS